MSNIKFIVPRNNPEDDEKCNKILIHTLQKLKCQCYQIANKPNENATIFTKYNAGINILLQNGLDDNDILVFVHSDVAIVDNQFTEKVNYLLQEKPDVGIIGIAGAVELSERIGWWMNSPDKLRGHLLQGNNQGSLNEAFHLQKGPVGYFDDLVCVDGCMMITRGKLIKEGMMFDDKTYTGNDFYDLDFCMNVLSLGYKIAVADILIFHQSSGMGSLKESWQKNKDIFTKKWIDKGYKIPFTPDQFQKKEFNSEIVEIEL